jgi:excisionase family DNA binding protein
MSEPDPNERVKQRRRKRKPDFYSVGQVADLLGVHVNTVVRWANAGRLPCVRTVGNQRRFPRDVVDRWVALGAHPPRIGY